MKSYEKYIEFNKKIESLKSEMCIELYNELLKMKKFGVKPESNSQGLDLIIPFKVKIYDNDYNGFGIYYHRVQGRENISIYVGIVDDIDNFGWEGLIITVSVKGYIQGDLIENEQNKQFKIIFKFLMEDALPYLESRNLGLM